MPRKSHVHKYILRPTDSRPVWACALGCGHFMPAHLTSLVEGRPSICWVCEEQFIMTIESMAEKNPRCENCRSGIITGDIAGFLSKAQ